MYDLILRNAAILDGTGHSAFHSSVVIEGDRILAVDNERDAKREIDLDGLVVAPGFIDLHTHSDFSLPGYPRADSMIRQGVTTQVTGNCGFSPFPIHPSRSELAQGWAAFFGGDPDWQWETAASFMSFLESLPLSTNVALQVGHGALRISAMGIEDRSPTEAELSLMKSLLISTLDDGVFGMTSGLMYPPSSYSDTLELIELASLLPTHNGFYASHIRGEGENLLAAVAEALQIANQAGVPIQLSHHKASGSAHWGRVADSLALIDSARDDGCDVTLDQYPYTASSTTITSGLPRWAMNGGVETLLNSLSDPHFRARIIDEMSPLNGVSKLDWNGVDADSIMIACVPDGPNKARYEHMLLSQIAEQRHEGPAETLLQLIEENHAQIQVVVFAMSEDDIQFVMRHPYVAVASDGWILSPESGGTPHPRSYGTFVRVLGRYVRELGVLSLEEAVRKMTSLPARRLGFSDRGLIAGGHIADLVIFDPETIGDRATFERPHEYCQGVEYVIVAGQVVVERGEDTGAKAGRVLRRNRI